jgi:hypothetical protein
LTYGGEINEFIFSLLNHTEGLKGIYENIVEQKNIEYNLSDNKITIDDVNIKYS